MHLYLKNFIYDDFYRKIVNLNMIIFYIILNVLQTVKQWKVIYYLEIKKKTSEVSNILKRTIYKPKKICLIFFY